MTNLNNSGPQPELPTVEIYTWTTCIYCIVAKLLLRLKGIQYTEYKIDGDDMARRKMVDRTGGARTLPQIFISSRHIGGCDSLIALQLKGQLSKLLSTRVDSGQA